MCIRDRGLPNVDMDSIYTGNGVSELINLCMQALLDTGDEILIPSPDYPLWTACATLAGGTPVHYICDEQAEWYPDIDDIERKKMCIRDRACTGRRILRLRICRSCSPPFPILASMPKPPATRRGI